jgi:hypothetical protein
MALKSDLQPVLDRLAGRPMKFQIKVGVVVAAAASAQPAKLATTAASAPTAATGEDEVRNRALSHPDVQRFQQLFPEGQIRQVRNLKE